MKPILIQAVGLAGTLLFFLSYQFRNNRTLFRVQFLSYLLYTAHLFLLGAVTGGVSYCINTFRSLCLASGKKALTGKKMCAVICLSQVAALVFTWEGVISALPVAANIASTVAGYTDDQRKIRFAGMFINSPLWIVYNIISGSLAGILDEVVTEISLVLSLFRFRQRAEEREKK